MKCEELWVSVGDGGLERQTEVDEKKEVRKGGEGDVKEGIGSGCVLK